jgi:hypothetical protein
VQAKEDYVLNLLEDAGLVTRSALENYKADNGIYPSDPASTETLAANADPSGGNPRTFVESSKYLYKSLAGDSDDDPTTSSANDTRNYFRAALEPSMLSPNPPAARTFIRDPFGYSYGYSTIKAALSDGVERLQSYLRLMVDVW